MTTTNKVYRGFLSLGSSGEGDDILHIGEEILAEVLGSDLQDYGPYVSVQYYTTISDTPFEVIQEEYLKTVMGLSEADFGHRYSEITGYLWTDESWQVGGHDLIGLLTMDIGRFCHLMVVFHAEEVQLPKYFPAAGLLGPYRVL